MKLDIEGIETLATADRHQVLTTLGALFSGFAARDVDMLTGVYSDDADWGERLWQREKRKPGDRQLPSRAFRRRQFQCRPDWLRRPRATSAD